jgi:hypothetical protein
VGIGVNNASAKLDVVGKLRLRDGTQALGRTLISDQNGLASWQLPDWTKVDNNIGAGYHVIFPSDINRTVGIGTASPSPFVKLHVNGGLRFEGNGPLAEGNILTVGLNGNAVWRAPSTDPSTTYWLPGQYANINLIRSSPNYENRPYWSFSQFVVNKDIGRDYPNDFLDVDNYPMAVQNSKHGMAIVVDGPAQQAKKFISFFDNGFENRYRGAIEGQTLTELQNDPTYVAYIAIQLLQTVGMGLEAAACISQGDIPESIVLVIQVIAWAADFGVTIDDMERNVGVAYTSGAADYAEWLERADRNEKFTFGDIVSVSGGKISKTITNGGQLMVISKAPIVLGNVPEEANKDNYEKVAFMGQVPVKVIGKTAIGDYIVAFSNGSGLGYAVNPKKITVEEMNRIAGVAWSASGNGELSMINTAVGVNTQAVNQLIQKQDDEIALLKNSINQLSAYLQTKDSSFTYIKLETKSVLVKTVTSNNNPVAVAHGPSIMGAKTLSAYDRIKKMNALSAEKIKKLIIEKPYFIATAMKVMKENAEKAGTDINSNPELKRLVTDEAYFTATVKKLYQVQ